MSTRRMPTRKQSDADKKTRPDATDKIPAFAIAGAKRNKNLLKMQQDVMERSRRNEKSTAGPREEILYVDDTRNVGVVLGEKLI